MAVAATSLGALELPALGRRGTGQVGAEDGKRQALAWFLTEQRCTGRLARATEWLQTASELRA